MSIAMWAIFEILRTVAWPDHRVAEQMMYINQRDFAAAWRADGGRKSKVPQVDFDKETVLAVFAGPRYGGGIRIENVRQVRAGNAFPPGTILVLYRQFDEPVSETLTSPSHVVAVERIEDPVIFVDADTDNGQMLVALDEKTNKALKNMQGVDRPPPNAVPLEDEETETGDAPWPVAGESTWPEY
jgi:hypothetical protein